MWVDHAAKLIGLTLLEHLVNWSTIQIPFAIGEKCDQVKVIRVDNKVGLLVEWKDQQLGYVHVFFTHLTFVNIMIVD